MEFTGGIRYFAVPFVERLCCLKYFVADDGGYGILHKEPFAFRNRSPLVYLIADYFLPSLAHNPNKQRVLQYPCDSCGAPKAVVVRGVWIFITESLGTFIGCRVGYAQIIQTSAYPIFAQSLSDKPGEYVPYYLSGILVNQQSILVIWVLNIAIGSKRADKLSPLPLVPKRPAHISRGLVGVLLIHKTGNTNLQAMYDLRVQKGINSWLIQGDKAGMIQRINSSKNAPGWHCSGMRGRDFSR